MLFLKVSIGFGGKQLAHTIQIDFAIRKPAEHSSTSGPRLNFHHLLKAPLTRTDYIFFHLCPRAISAYLLMLGLYVPPHRRIILLISISKCLAVRKRTRTVDKLHPNQKPTIASATAGGGYAALGPGPGTLLNRFMYN